jgi:hypothetical protein
LLFVEGGVQRDRSVPDGWAAPSKTVSLGIVPAAISSVKYTAKFVARN